MAGTVHIYHHNDMDGIFSGLFMYKALGFKSTTKVVTFAEVDYYQPIKLDHIQKGDIVAFVDYSMGPNKDVLMDMLRRFSGDDIYFVWIDHHTTSLDIKKEIEDSGVLDNWDPNSYFININTKVCATVLTYLYYLDYATMDGNGGLSTDVSKENWMRDCWPAIPDYIKYVDSCDRFIKSMPYTDEFSLGYTSHTELHDPMKLLDAFDNKYHMANVHFTGSLLIQDFIDTGTATKGYMENIHKGVMKNSFNFTIIDETEATPVRYDCIAVNSPLYGSQQFGDEYNHKDIVVRFVYTADNKYMHSIYSRHGRYMPNIFKYTCCDIAKMLAEQYGTGGGGGHPGAAGFSTNVQILKPDCYIIIQGKDEPRIFVTDVDARKKDTAG